jgi:chromosome partitioning protein
MKTISIMNVKGGVGKTITAVNLAQILACDHNFRVLLIDADAQADASSMLIPEEDEESADCYGMLTAGVVAEDYIQSTCYRNLDIVCGGSDMFWISMESAERYTRTMHDFLSAVSPDYDFCIIDCPPHFSAPSVAAICNSTHVIVPVKLDAFGIRGCRFLVKQVEAILEINPDISMPLVLVTMWRNSEVCRQSYQLLRQDLPEDVVIFPTVIRRTDKADESTFYGQALGEYSRYSSAGRDYRNFTSELLSIVTDHTLDSRKEE